MRVRGRHIYPWEAAWSCAEGLPEIPGSLAIEEVAHLLALGFLGRELCS